MLLRKLLSGGQTGVERGVCKAAIASGLSCDGKGLKNRNRPVGCAQKDRGGLSVSTRGDDIAWNATHSDATLIYLMRHRDGGVWTARMTEGSRKAGKCCAENELPCRTEMLDDAEATLEWLRQCFADRQSEGVVLYVTGPTEAEERGIQARAMAFMLRLIALDRRADEVRGR